MRVHVCAVGRLRAGPEHALISDYLTRFDRTGRALGLGPAQILEVEDKKGGGQAAEADLLPICAAKRIICCLWERWSGRIC
jgi:23S rRNA (pseudouridine1915-N3)-methyltransferase